MTLEDVVTEASAQRGWPLEKARAVVNAFMANGKWGLVDLFLGFRAGFKCEYCGLDLLSTAHAYKLWEKDHIEPNGGNDPENLALACLVCNSKLKNRWVTPTRQGGRSERIKEVQDHVSARRDHVEEEIASYRELLT